MISLRRWRSPAGRHRATDQQPHKGWEGREGEIRLLAEDQRETTAPIKGLPLPAADLNCPVDQCTWPEGSNWQATQFGLLEHLRHHPPIDFIRTIGRLRRANTKLQERF